MTDQLDLFLALQDSLTLLASAGMRQMQYVANLDEISGVRGGATNHAIARQFYALVPELASMFTSGTISPSTVKRLEVIHLKLKEMDTLAHATLWKDEALFSAPEWQQLRSLAAGALRQLRLPYGIAAPAANS